MVYALLASTLAFVPDFADAFGLVKIAAALAGCLFVRAHQTDLDRPLAACVLAFLASLAFSADPIMGLTGVYSQPFHGALALLPAVVFFYAGGPAKRVAAWVGIASGAACAAQLAGLCGPPLGLVGARAGGTMGSPVFLGALIAVAIPAILGLATRWPGSWVGAAGLGGAFLALAAIGSRGAWLAALAGLGAFWAATGRGRRYLALAAILPPLLALSVGIRPRSDAGRVETWAIAARAGAVHPVLGWGPDAFPLAIRAGKTPALMEALNDKTIQASAHNDLLQAWATTGALGLAAYLWLWWALLAGAWRARDAAVFGSLVALFVVAKANPVPPTAVYLAAALAGGVFRRSIYERQNRIVLTAALRVLAAAALLASLVLLSAEWRHSYGIKAVREGDLKGGADLIRLANELAPDNIAYAARRIDLIFRLAPVAGDREKDFARRALRVASCVVKAHPQDAGAYELMAEVELWAAPLFGHGLNRAALKSARRAVALDPLFEFSARKLEAAAKVVKDKNEEARARALVEKIAHMTVMDK